MYGYIPICFGYLGRHARHTCTFAATRPPTSCRRFRSISRNLISENHTTSGFPSCVFIETDARDPGPWRVDEKSLAGIPFWNWTGRMYSIWVCPPRSSCMIKSKTASGWCHTRRPNHIHRECEKIWTLNRVHTRLGSYTGIQSSWTRIYSSALAGKHIVRCGTANFNGRRYARQGLWFSGRSSQ